MNRNIEELEQPPEGDRKGEQQEEHRRHGAVQRTAGLDVYRRVEEEDIPEPRKRKIEVGKWPQPDQDERLSDYQEGQPEPAVPGAERSPSLLGHGAFYALVGAVSDLSLVQQVGRVTGITRGVRSRGTDDKVRESPLLGSRVIGIAIGLYVVLVLVASFYFHISLTADRVAVLLVIAALGTGRIRAFLRDWSAFVVVVLAWQVLQGMSESFTHFKPHVTEMIDVDKFLFHGTVPTVWLQQHFFDPNNTQVWRGVLPDRSNLPTVHHVYFMGTLHWYDVAASIFYALHFITPLGIAFILWFWKRPIFLEYMASFLLLALAGFATFVLFPAAPPWIAADWWHYLPHVTRIFQYGISVFGGEQSYSSFTQWVWAHGGYDYFGAVPSEHAAFPFLGFLYLRKAWPRGGWSMLLYCVGVWLSVVYLGEHYVTDVIVGVVYASLVYVGVQVALSRRHADRPAATESLADAVSESLPA